MLDDQQLRRRLVDYARGVDVDADEDLARVLDTGRHRAVRGRIALLVAIPLIVVLAVGGVVLALGGGGRPDGGTTAAVPGESRLTGTWVRTLVAEGSVPGEAAGTWTMVLADDGAMTLVPPEAWAVANSRPNGVYVRTGDALRTNVFAGEVCGGEAGEYSLTVDHAALDLSASVDTCPLREAVLDGRWERAP
jgi:hypothetical protein